jgi:hypothetical protein
MSQELAQSTSSRRCSDSVSNVRVQQTKNGRRSNVARDPFRTSPTLADCGAAIRWRRAHIVEGEFALVTNAGRETVRPGTCIAFPAGTNDGHHFLNLTDRDATFLVVGDRTADDEVTYPDIDLRIGTGTDGKRGYLHKDGSPYPRAQRD